ncbi:MAG TPA: YbjQ family protein [Tissierellales bacterium]|nr:YbjQ family protein [Tissierellales bacterium]
MLITNLPILPGNQVELLGIVDGTVVFSKHFGKDLGAAFKNLAGGELKGYTEMIEDAKNQALERLQREADALEADGVLNVQYAITNMQQGSALVVMVTGTAYKNI